MGHRRDTRDELRPRGEHRPRIEDRREVDEDHEDEAAEDWEKPIRRAPQIHPFGHTKRHASLIIAIIIVATIIISLGIQYFKDSVGGP